MYLFHVSMPHVALQSPNQLYIVVLGTIVKLAKKIRFYSDLYSVADRSWFSMSVYSKTEPFWPVSTITNAGNTVVSKDTEWGLRYTWNSSTNIYIVDLIQNRLDRIAAILFLPIQRETRPPEQISAKKSVSLWLATYRRRFSLKLLWQYDKLCWPV